VPITYATAESCRYVTVEQLRPILGVLTTITWPCPAEAIPDIINRLGWTLTSDRVHVMADTHLPLNRTVGDFARPPGELRELNFPVSDTVDEADAAGVIAVKESFTAVSRIVESLLGSESGHADGINPQMWWDLDTGGRIRLDSITIRLQARLVSKLDADVERFEETHDMSQFHDEE